MKTVNKIDVRHQVFPKGCFGAPGEAGADLCVSKLAYIIINNTGKDGDWTAEAYNK